MSKSIIPVSFALVPLLTIMLMSVPETAFAYLDPGTITMAFQGLVAAIVGGLFFLKMRWHKIKAFFAKKNDKQ